MSAKKLPLQSKSELLFDLSGRTAFITGGGSGIEQAMLCAWPSKARWWKCWMFDERTDGPVDQIQREG